MTNKNPCMVLTENFDLDNYDDYGDATTTTTATTTQRLTVSVETNCTFSPRYLPFLRSRSLHFLP